jgi:hypothetical protein
MAKKWGSIPSTGITFFSCPYQAGQFFAKGLEASYPYTKYLRHDAECSAVSKAEVKNGCSYTSPPPTSTTNIFTARF